MIRPAAHDDRSDSAVGATALTSRRAWSAPVVVVRQAVNAAGGAVAKGRTKSVQLARVGSVGNGSAVANVVTKASCTPTTGSASAATEQQLPGQVQ
jgi:hypothetical protein